ncbi:MAG TPA: TIGR04283 family arsenosugar biosynthesis glycosyltransferase [Ktedonobacteraceae bacterium]|nr:TIGR04283 family arsenosugar biosynthesis glycosyltransferase [Ktedonobacteraceae bacterium]
MRFSIIVPVLNEETVLEEQLAHLRDQIGRHADQDCELIIVDGGSDDATVSIAEKYGVLISSLRGRATQMNAGAAVASGDVLIFLHADTHLPDDAFATIERALSSPHVVGGAFRICFNCDLWPYRLVAFTVNLRARLRTLFTGDQAYFIRATSFRAIGGYPEQPLMEDLEIINRLRKVGKVVLLPQYVTTSARRHEKTGLARTILFMWYLRTLYRLGVSPTRLQRMYIDIR